MGQPPQMYQRRDFLRGVVRLRLFAPLVSPKRARCLFTMRAATSFSRPRYLPVRSNFRSNSLYSRSRFGLAPLGIILFQVCCMAVEPGPFQYNFTVGSFGQCVNQVLTYRQVLGTMRGGLPTAFAQTNTRLILAGTGLQISMELICHYETEPVAATSAP